MALNNFNLSGELSDYVSNLGWRIDPIQLEFHQHCQQTLVNAQLSIPLEQAPFMEMLVRLASAQKILEIGVYAGFSTYSLAKGLPENGTLLGLEIDERFPKVGKPFWDRAGLGEKITIQFGDAREEIIKLIEEKGKDSFDFAFIDADKNAYQAYYENCLKLVQPGGVICIDNVLWKGKVVDETDQTTKTQAIRELNEQVKNDPRVEMVMLPLWDGLTILKVK